MDILVLFLIVMRMLFVRWYLLEMWNVLDILSHVKGYYIFIYSVFEPNMHAEKSVVFWEPTSIAMQFILCFLSVTD